MKYFPLFVKTQSLKVLVVGAGEVATRKTELMLKTQAHVTVVAPWACDTMRDYVEAGKVNWHQRVFDEQDIQGKQLVFCRHRRRNRES